VPLSGRSDLRLQSITINNTHRCVCPGAAVATAAGSVSNPGPLPGAVCQREWCILCWAAGEGGQQTTDTRSLWSGLRRFQCTHNGMCAGWLFDVSVAHAAAAAAAGHRHSVGGRRCSCRRNWAPKIMRMGMATHLNMLRASTFGLRVRRTIGLACPGIGA
jgi:hypothetical protein